MLAAWEYPNALARPSGAAIQLYKNNTDNKGASYRCHENYLMSPPTGSPISCGT
jgi:hypothetical protein